MIFDYKAELRIKARKIREALSGTERERKSLAITQAFLELDEVKKATRILLYAPMGHEVNTWPLMESLKNKSLFLPILQEEGIFEIGEYQGVESLKKNRYDILEPTKKVTQPPKLDLVVLPGLAFDVAGNRLGMGKGYYDRFLEKHPLALRVGLAFSEQIFDRLPQKPYDRPAHLVITDTQVYRSI